VKEQLPWTGVSENNHRSKDFPELGKPQASRKEKSAESQKKFFEKRGETLA
jgi:hypothetical protein